MTPKPPVIIHTVLPFPTQPKDIVTILEYCKEVDLPVTTPSQLCYILFGNAPAMLKWFSVVSTQPLGHN